MIQCENLDALPIEDDQGQNGSGTVSDVDAWLTRSDSPHVLGRWKRKLADLEAMKARGDLTKDWGECSLINARTVVDDLTALLAEQPVATGERGWQPIESAPMDHSVVLLYQPATQEYAEGVGQGHRTDLREHAHDKWVFQATGWRGEPTHWMPLPAPPRTLAEQPRSEGKP